MRQPGDATTAPSRVAARHRLHDRGAARARLPARPGARLLRLQARQRHPVRAPAQADRHGRRGPVRRRGRAIYGTVGYQAPEVGAPGCRPPPTSTPSAARSRCSPSASARRRGARATAARRPPDAARHESLHRLLLRATDPDPRLPVRLRRRDGRAARRACCARCWPSRTGRPRPAPSAVFSAPRGTFAADLLLGPSACRPARSGRVAAQLVVPLVEPDDPAAGMLAAVAAGRPVPAGAAADWRADWLRGDRGAGRRRSRHRRAPRSTRSTRPSPGELAPKLALAATAECAGRRRRRRSATTRWSPPSTRAGPTRRSGSPAPACGRASRPAAVTALHAVPTTSSAYVAAQLAAVEATLSGRRPAGWTTASCARPRTRLERLDPGPDHQAAHAGRGARRGRRAGLRRAGRQLPERRTGTAVVLGCPWQERPLRLALEQSLRDLGPAQPGRGRAGRPRRPGQPRAPADAAMTGARADEPATAPLTPLRCRAGRTSNSAPRPRPAVRTACRATAPPPPAPPRRARGAPRPPSRATGSASPVGPTCGCTAAAPAPRPAGRRRHPARTAVTAPRPTSPTASAPRAACAAPTARTAWRSRSTAPPRSATAGTCAPATRTRWRWAGPRPSGGGPHADGPRRWPPWSATASRRSRTPSGPHGPRPTRRSIACCGPPGPTGAAHPGGRGRGRRGGRRLVPRGTRERAVVHAGLRGRSSPPPRRVTVGWVGDSRAYWLAARTGGAAGARADLRHDPSRRTPRECRAAAAGTLDPAVAAARPDAITRWLGADGDARARRRHVHPGRPGRAAAVHRRAVEVRARRRRAGRARPAGAARRRSPRPRPPRSPRPRWPPAARTTSPSPSSPSTLTEEEHAP